MISVIIPAHNEEKTIGKCLTSLKNQKCEIILVDDGSTDNTIKIAKKTRVPDKIINFNKGHSAAFARNRGSEKANGKWLIFIDADALVEKNFIKKIKEFIKKNNNIDGSDYLVFSYNPKTIFQKAWSAYRKSYLSMGFVHIVKKNVFKKLGGFNERVFYFEDSEFKNRFLKNGYIFKGPINVKMFHMETETWSDFIRQRKWQGKQARVKYFLPCFFPPLMLIQFFKIWWKSEDFKNTFYWIVLDFIGRYISLLEKIKLFLSIKY